MMPSEPHPVALAPIERVSGCTLQEQVAKFARQEGLTAALEALPLPVLVVNDHRQIVYANQTLADLVGAENGVALVGIRPGEALHCHHVDDGEAGCGTSPFCRYCGAARAIAEAEVGIVHGEEAFILREFSQSPSALDLQISTKQLILEGERFTLLSIMDISDEKRRHAMERAFFHDVLNTVQKMRIAADLLMDEDSVDEALLRRVIQKSVEQLAEEILVQRDLADMENGVLGVRPTEVRTQELLIDLVESYLERGLAQGKQVTLAAEMADVAFVVDKTQLRRVLNNMLKNAIESEGPGATITVGCRVVHVDGVSASVNGAQVEFWVHNPSVMSEAVRWQVFQRSFSTKGKGRGLGTYSMKVLTERYLEGEITFSSEGGVGTTFRARYPMLPSYAQDTASA
ncbi:MAG: PAS domain-containing sensor histidine kinase [Anaerolineae bacterium]|nr:PAS domain-containing sensor histidine kinase [Anaerolineae bacterium]